MHFTLVQKVEAALKRAGFVLHKTHSIEYHAEYCPRSVRVIAKPGILRNLANALMDEGFNAQLCLRTSTITIR